MRRARRITHIPSCRIVVISFGKSAGQHKNFLTTGMLMAREALARLVPHHAGRPSFLASQGSEEHTAELQSRMRISYAVIFLNKKTKNNTPNHAHYHPIHLITTP